MRLHCAVIELAPSAADILPSATADCTYRFNGGSACRVDQLARLTGGADAVPVELRR